MLGRSCALDRPPPPAELRRGAGTGGCALLRLVRALLPVLDDLLEAGLGRLLLRLAGRLLEKGSDTACTPLAT
jgi:hypothetical protein